MKEPPKPKRRPGRPTVRRLKIDATPDGITRKLFAQAKTARSGTAPVRTKTRSLTVGA